MEKIIKEIENKKNKMIEILNEKTSFWWNPLEKSKKLIVLSEEINCLCTMIKNKDDLSELKNINEEFEKLKKRKNGQ